LKAPIANLKEFEIGPIHRTNLIVAVANIPLKENIAIDGILGMDVMRSYSLNIDKKNQKIVFEP
jgi:hypothetical protein